MNKNVKINELKFDDKNANKHTEHGLNLLKKSLSELGAGRSILIDKNNNIIAGNGVIETAGKIGLDNVKIIETDGKEIIAVKRIDVDINTKKGRELAIADNKTAVENINFDIEFLNSLSEDFNIILEDWSFKSPNYEFTEEELNKFFEPVNHNDNNNDNIKHLLILNFTEDTLNLVKTKLLEYGKTYEDAICNLLEI